MATRTKTPEVDEADATTKTRATKSTTTAAKTAAKPKTAAKAATKTATKAPAKTAAKTTATTAEKAPVAKTTTRKASKATASKKTTGPEDEDEETPATEVADDADETKDETGDDDDTKSTGKDEALPTGALVLSMADDDEVPVYSSTITGATADPVKDYLKQIGKVALLNAAEEVELAMRIEAGLFAEEKLSALSDVEKRSQLGRDLTWVAKDGARAKSHLLGANLRLVVSLAKRYTGRGMQFLDLIQEGNLGLIRAVEKFDYTKGFKF